MAPQGPLNRSPKWSQGQAGVHDPPQLTPPWTPGLSSLRAEVSRTEGETVGPQPRCPPCPALGLHCCAQAFSSCGERGPLFIAVRGPLTIVASLVAEHRLQMRRLSSCGSRAQLLRGMWDLPRPGLEPVSPALAGRFSTTAPPGKPPSLFFNSLSRHNFIQ